MGIYSSDGPPPSRYYRKPRKSIVAFICLAVIFLSVSSILGLQLIEYYVDAGLSVEDMCKSLTDSHELFEFILFATFINSICTIILAVIIAAELMFSKIE